MAAFKDISALIEDKNKRVLEGLYRAVIILYSILLELNVWLWLHSMRLNFSPVASKRPFVLFLKPERTV